MAEDIKQAFKDILIWGTIIGVLMGVIAYLSLSLIDNSFDRDNSPTTCYCAANLVEIEDLLGDGLKLEYWGDYN